MTTTRKGRRSLEAQGTAFRRLAEHMGEAVGVTVIFDEKAPTASIDSKKQITLPDREGFHDLDRLAMLIHEAHHLKHTQWKAVKESFECQALKNVFNIVEDFRIDRRAAAQYSPFWSMIKNIRQRQSTEERARVTDVDDIPFDLGCFSALYGGLYGLSMGTLPPECEAWYQAHRAEIQKRIRPSMSCPAALREARWIVETIGEAAPAPAPEPGPGEGDDGPGDGKAQPGSEPQPKQGDDGPGDEPKDELKEIADDLGDWSKGPEQDDEADEDETQPGPAEGEGEGEGKSFGDALGDMLRGGYERAAESYETIRDAKGGPGAAWDDEDVSFKRHKCPRHDRWEREARQHRENQLDELRVSLPITQNIENLLQDLMEGLIDSSRRADEGKVSMRRLPELAMGTVPMDSKTLKADHKAYIALLLDQSPSMGYYKALVAHAATELGKAIERLAGCYGADNIRQSVVIFGRDAATIKGFDEPLTDDHSHEMIDGPINAGGTVFKRGIEECYQTFDDSGAMDDPYAHKIVIVLTDGDFHDEDIKYLANKLRGDIQHIFIGITMKGGIKYNNKHYRNVTGKASPFKAAVDPHYNSELWPVITDILKDAAMHMSEE